MATRFNEFKAITMCWAGELSANVTDRYLHKDRNKQWLGGDGV